MDNFRRKFLGKTSPKLTASNITLDPCEYNAYSNMNVYYDGSYAYNDGTLLVVSYTGDDWIRVYPDTNSTYCLICIDASANYNENSSRTSQVTISYKGEECTFNITLARDSYSSTYYVMSNCTNPTVGGTYQDTNNYYLTYTDNIRLNTSTTGSSYSSYPNESGGNGYQITCNILAITEYDSGKFKLTNRYSTKYNTFDIYFDDNMGVDKTTNVMFNECHRNYYTQPAKGILVREMRNNMHIAMGESIAWGSRGIELEQKTCDLNTQRPATLSWDIYGYVYNGLNNVSVGTILTESQIYAARSLYYMGKFTFTFNNPDQYDLNPNAGSAYSTNCSWTETISPS